MNVSRVVVFAGVVAFFGIVCSTPALFAQTADEIRAGISGASADCDAGFEPACFAESMMRMMLAAEGIVDDADEARESLQVVVRECVSPEQFLANMGLGGGGHVETSQAVGELCSLAFRAGGYIDFAWMMNQAELEPVAERECGRSSATGDYYPCYLSAVWHYHAARDAYRNGDMQAASGLASDARQMAEPACSSGSETSCELLEDIEGAQASLAEAALNERLQQAQDEREQSCVRMALSSDAVSNECWAVIERMRQEREPTCFERCTDGYRDCRAECGDDLCRSRCDSANNSCTEICAYDSYLRATGRDGIGQ